ncbi:VP2 [Philantomba monticola polyomavirus 1]|uniref:Minor capsid protein VP2 n=1 Tax=Philantomba monticola polyomavirus 1 TaxID=2170411 RepID=A0A2S1CJH9_9POLY|nr:VP2 [Philantomba monticola polyomavirus 1]AWD33735.1 VP2 [Philantomba monticola polyomavirus 1]
MGAIISSLVEMIALATEISAASGLTIEALLTGEALGALEAEVFSLMSIEGLSGIEALAQLGWTAEQFSNLAFIASTFSDVVGYGVFFQTTSGLASLISVGLRLGLDVASVNRNQTEQTLLAIFGEVSKLIPINISYHLNPLKWEESLKTNCPKDLENIPIEMRHIIGVLMQNSRWVIQSSPTTDPQKESGDIVEFQPPPGGANQPATPDWMLPLILRLNGASKEKSSLCS